MKRVGNKITMVRGDTERFTLTYRNKVTKEIIPFVAGERVYLTVKKTAKDLTPLFQVVITEFVDGKCPVVILPEHTKELEFRDYKYDIQVTRLNGDINTIIWPDTFIVAEEITDDE